MPWEALLLVDIAQIGVEAVLDRVSHKQQLRPVAKDKH